MDSALFIGGGLFEYGSDSDIIENLDRFFENSPADARVTGSLIFDRAYVNPGYLGFTEFIGVQIRYLGLEGLQKLLAQTSWILEESHEIEKNLYSVFVEESVKYRLFITYGRHLVVWKSKPFMK